MIKKLITLIVCLSLIWVNGIYFASMAVENSPLEYERKIILFKDSTQTRLFQNQLNSLLQDKPFEMEHFASLDAMALPMTEEIKTLIRDFQHYLTIVDDAEVSSYPFITSLDTSLQDDNWNIHLTGAPELWEKGYSGKNIKIAILDTGIDGTHEAFQDRIVDFAEFSQYGGIFRSEPRNSFDSDAHGTHVAGIAAGWATGKAIGLAPKALLGAGIVIPRGSGTMSQIMGGLEWVLDPDGNPETNDQPNIVNLSLGMPGYIKLWSPIFNKLLKKNILPIAAVGNEGDGICGSPGSTPNVFSVGAFDHEYRPAWFSSGSDRLIWEDRYYSKHFFTKPEISTPGVNIYSAIPGGKYARSSGTSMASPHAAGAAALLMEAFPNASAWDIWHYLILGAEDMGQPGPDSRYGHGAMNVKNSYDLLNQSYRISGHLQGDHANAHIINRQTDLPIYINPKGEFSSYLLPGTYSLDIFYHNTLQQSVNITVNNTDLKRDFSIPEASKFILHGVVKDHSGKPLQAKIHCQEKQWKTDEFGRFTIESETMQTLTIRSSGYVEEKVRISAESPYINVRLSKADLLVIEGFSNFLTSINPPRWTRDYYLKSLEELGKKAAFLSVEEESYSYEDIQDYSLLIYYCESGTLSQSEHAIFEKYLSKGGRVIFSGRMMLSLEGFLRQNFLTSLFTATTREFLIFPSISGLKELQDTSGLGFSLSGDQGANNQETCDILFMPNPGRFIEPFLKFTDTSGFRYAGARKADGISKSILLGFGIEGIGSPSERTKFLKYLLEWMDHSSSFKADLPHHSTFYLSISDEDQRSHTIEITDGKIHLNNLLPKVYSFLLEGYGYKSEHFKIDFSKHQLYYQRFIPEKAHPYSVNFIFNKTSIDKGIYQLSYKSRIIQEDYFSLDKNLSFKLPPGQYSLLMTAKNMIPMKREFVVAREDLIFEVELGINSKKILIIDDTRVGVYFRDSNKAQEEYIKTLLSRKINYEVWNVIPNGYPDFFDLLPYSLVIYLTANNPLAFKNTAILQALGKYLDEKGSLAIFGNTSSTALRDYDFLEEYAGISFQSSNTRERTIFSSGTPWFGELKFDLYTSYNEGLPRYPSFVAAKEGVRPLFYYINSQLISSTLYQHDHYKFAFFPFGMENIILPSVKEEFMNGFLKIFEEELTQTD
jgi:hypothetical protein